MTAPPTNAGRWLQREYLAWLGIESARIDTRSNGENNPAESRRETEALSQHRRDEFVVLTPSRGR